MITHWAQGRLCFSVPSGRLTVWSHGSWNHHHNHLLRDCSMISSLRADEPVRLPFPPTQLQCRLLLGFLFCWMRKSVIFGHVSEERKKRKDESSELSPPEQSAPQINSNKKTGGESLTPAQLVNVPDVTTSCLAALPADTEMDYGMMARHPGGNLGLDAFWIPNQWRKAASKMLKDPDNYQKCDRWHDTSSQHPPPPTLHCRLHMPTPQCCAPVRHKYMCNKCVWPAGGAVKVSSETVITPLSEETFSAAAPFNRVHTYTSIHNSWFTANHIRCPEMLADMTTLAC